ncbi:hypothetical protein PC41400_27840 [Paenibacillus chitinolyticus]|uniref:Uncharacterized protein n=1 Tax=Paenibacillus chitinolyticus TaxID=79263 RepID=A0A410X3S6_9BACL|nr:hypothetical protein [Paenibacillus chitinolyticus]MCY9593456.1 hypothetical protein [Paenibacillus chitinolyticus]MCY9596207.1 hypothetical protein [Paenibacillus chitinolyticus]QAV21272.1 hypothetical protein PC41400_27840 [Paenibacillus chitinolyticus]
MKKTLVSSVLAVSIVAGALAAPSASFASALKTPPLANSVSTTVAPTAVQPDGLISNIIKKAITSALRYGGSYLGKLLEKLSPSAGQWLTKYSGKIADFLDSITNWQENIIATGLVSLGIPPAEAWEIAKAIVWLAGI